MHLLAKYAHMDLADPCMFICPNCTDHIGPLEHHPPTQAPTVAAHSCLQDQLTPLYLLQQGPAHHLDPANHMWIILIIS